MDRSSLTLPRRKLLQVGGLGMLGLHVPQLVRAEQLQTHRLPARAKSVIFLFQWGGPSHIDTFDRKPQAPQGIRGEFADIATSVPGLTVCDQLPGMARVMDKVVLVHGVQHDMKNHNPAGYYALTARRAPLDDIRLKNTPDLFPAYGSVIDRHLPRSPGVPSFVSYPHVVRDGSITPGQRGTFLGQQHDPLLVLADPNADGFGVPELALPTEIPAERLTRRKEMLDLLDAQRAGLESAASVGLSAMYDRAYAMLLAPNVRQAFDLSQEPEAVRTRYGRTTYGQGCLLARRLVESGVKFVNVYFSDTIGGQKTDGGGWDTHGFNNTRMYPILKSWQLPMTDQTLPTLLTDLDERGLLDETLVVWMGEFGRTPKLNANASRDHWPTCYTVLLAGGGLKRGLAVGASDRNGAYPAQEPIRLGDIAATIYHQLGLDPRTLLHDLEGRPFPLAEGTPLTAAIA